MAYPRPIAFLGRSLHWLTEQSLACIPRPRPSARKLKDVKIVAHRGERDNRVVFENTFAAFDNLIEASVWGIEFDVRWSRDLEPVVIHDLDLLRVFGRRECINELSVNELAKVVPEIPTLEALLDRYAGKLHCMIELKACEMPNPHHARQRLSQLLAPLSPNEDFHILAVDTDVFDLARELPSSCWLPVARANTTEMSQFALNNGCAGFAGPYPLIRKHLVERHHATGQQVGMGFPSHRNTFRHAVELGADWVFTNQALRLNQI